MQNSSTDKDAPALLVVAYLRPKNLEDILRIAFNAGVRKFYVSVDAPKSQDGEFKALHNAVIRTVENFQKANNAEIVTHFRNLNVGCSAAVLSSVDWLFRNESIGMILEDDCIPSPDFFHFVNTSMPLIKRERDVWLACGTQFVEGLTQARWYKSRYALTWGWATTRDKWIEMSLKLRGEEVETEYRSKIGYSERLYWEAGARRARTGIIDAWDIPLVQQMLASGKYAILPAHSLVTNVGNDQVATHTIGHAIGINTALGSFANDFSYPLENREMDEWLQRSFYQIRARHILSTKVTRFLDILLLRRHRSLPLETRWKSAQI